MRMRHILIVSTAFCLLAFTPARADDQPSAADETAIHGVIEQQLEALNKEDGAAAEAFAAPVIKERFPTPESFMGMVKGSYSALIRPRSTHFESLSQTGLGPVQKMTLVDANGQVWTVGYTMMMVDGQWLISGCFILKSDAVST